MVSYLVMKNNCKRLLKKKSTFLIIVLLPLLLIVSSTVIERIGKKQIRVGIIGSNQYIQSVKEQFKSTDVLCKQAYEKSIATDQIMGKYTCILKETMSVQEQEKIVNGILQSSQYRDDETPKNDELSDTERMLLMLLTIYMTVSVIYSMKYISEKKDGLVERVRLSGGTTCSYLKGYFLSNCFVLVAQLLLIVGIVTLLYDKFSISIVRALGTVFFITVISSVYSMIITIISKSELMAGVLGSSITVLLSVLGGTFFPMATMPKIIQTISVISPMKWLLWLLNS